MNKHACCRPLFAECCLVVNTRKATARPRHSDLQVQIMHKPELILQAADFLDDGEAVHSLCKLIATCLFSCSVHDRADPKVCSPETLQV